MRVLLLGKYDFDDVAGGIEKYCKLFLDNLPEGIEPFALYFNVNNQTVDKENSSYPVVKVGVWRTIASTSISFSVFSKLREIFKTFRPDIVFIQCPNPMMHFAYLIAPCIHHKLVINWQSDIVRQKRLLKLYQPFVNRLLQKADAVIVHSSDLKESIQLRSCDNKKIHVIPIGVIAPSVNKHEEFLAGKDVFKLFACGRHVGYKGFDVLLRALAQLPVNVILTLGGVGPQTGLLKALAKELNVDHRVNFVGFINEDDLGAYIMACDVYCFPSVSQNEAFGIAQVEAMLLGKPVIGFELHNGTTFINKNYETGLVVENKNVEQYAKAVLMLMNDEHLRQKLGRQAQQRAKKLFGLNEMVNKTLSVFYNCLSDNKFNK